MDYRSTGLRLTRMTAHSDATKRRGRNAMGSNSMKGRVLVTLVAVRLNRGK